MTGAPLERVQRGGATVLLRRTRIDGAVHRGSVRLSDALALDARDVATLCDGDPVSSLEGAVFLDTETTGLEGGAGTHVFLLGAASFESGALEVRQWLLPDPADEPALLDALGEEASRARSVVTFHGRHFDLPRLEERCLLARRTFPFARTPHIDLLVGARRVLRLRAGRASLQHLERTILGTHRTDDLPGSECPAAWFAFVRGLPSPMERVLEHNLLDLLTLPALAVSLAAAARGAAPSEDVHGAARFLAKAGEEPRATGLHQDAAVRAEDGALAAKAHVAAGRLLRRAGEDARSAAENLAATLRDPGLPDAWVALSKHHEHETGDLPLALECARRAQKALFLRSRSARAKEDAAARIARLESRIRAAGS